MNPTLRILDANFNRAREAMRVMEEYARFVLDDASIAGACKNLRHDLTATIENANATFSGPSGSDASLAGASLIAQRDIVGDVGQETKTPAEFERASPQAVATAAAKRLSEALRAIEEYGKLIDPGFAAAVEKLRYRGYEIERRLALTIAARQRFADVRLYVIITEALCRGDWFATAKAALDGGADCLQLREKNLPDSELLARAKRLADLCRERDRLFIVNDRADIAAASGAHGLHIGQDDIPLSAARRIMPPGTIIGLSTHTLEQVEEAAEACPDYVAVGPMFDTATKPQQHLATPALVAKAREITSLPVVAIGGITADNMDEVLAAGADCVCVCSAVIGADDPSAAAEKLKARTVVLSA